MCVPTQAPLRNFWVFFLPAYLTSQVQKQKMKGPSYQRRAKARFEASLKPKGETVNTHEAYGPQKPGYVVKEAENSIAIHEALRYDLTAAANAANHSGRLTTSHTSASLPTIPAASPSTNTGSQLLPASQSASHSSNAADLATPHRQFTILFDRVADNCAARSSTATAWPAQEHGRSLEELLKSLIWELDLT